MTLGTKSEDVLQLIIDEGPQHISEIRKRFGAGGRHCANYLTKVGVHACKRTPRPTMTAKYRFKESA